MFEQYATEEYYVDAIGGWWRRLSLWPATLA